MRRRGSKAQRGLNSEIATQATRQQVTPPAPNAPTVVSNTSSSVKLSWEAPTLREGVSAITKYSVQYQRTDGSTWSTSSNSITSPPYTVASLEPNVYYYVRVQAYNSDGWGDWSPNTTVSTEASVPGQVNPRPSASMVPNDPSAITVSWATPIDTGGLPIIGYRVAMDEFCDRQYLAETRSTTNTTLVWTDVTPAVEYCFTVAAMNAKGYGVASWSSVQVATTGSDIHESACFDVTLDLPFSQWQSVNRAVKADLASKMGVSLSKVKVSSVREGSTIVNFDVTVRNITASFETVAHMESLALTKNWTLGGVPVKSVSTPVPLMSNGPGILQVSPNLGPSTGGTVVTITGLGTSTTILVNETCLVDGQIATSRPYGSKLLCTIPASAKTYQLISLQGGSNTMPFEFYQPNTMRLTYITPTFGSVTGNSGDIAVHGTPELVQFLKLATQSDVSVMKCRFRISDDSNVTTVANHVTAANGTFALCKPPPSFVNSEAIAGPVVFELALDGQHWLQPLEYTYRCATAEYYVPNTAGPMRGKCEACPKGAICDGTDRVLARDGWYGVRTATLSKPEPLFEECINKAACTRSDEGRENPCHEMYDGLLCAMCVNGTGSNFDFKCVECGSKGELLAIFFGGLTLAFLLVGAITIYTIRKMESAAFKEGTNIIVTISMTGWSMLQSMTFFQGFDYDWPPLIESLFSVSDAASGSAISMQTECWANLISNQPYVYTNAVFMISLAPVFLLIMVLVLLIWVALFKGVEYLKRRILIAAIYVMFFFQPYAIRGILQATTCIEVGDESVLYYQMDVLCDSDLHVTWKWALIAAYLVYAFVLPGWLMLVMHRDRALFLAEDEETIRIYGFAINAYKAEFFYWQFCIMYRKIAQITLITLARPAGIVVQAQLALLVSMVAIVLHLQMKPFKNELVNNLEKVSLGSFAITAWVGVLMSQSKVKEQAKWSLSLSMIILVVNTLALLYVLYALAIKGLGRIEEAVKELRESRLANDHPVDKTATDVELAEMNPVAMITLDQQEEDKKDLEEVGVIADDGNSQIIDEDV